MEDRVEGTATDRPGAALFALAAIIVITAAWWALALWPVGASEPDWLARTRSACFGSHAGGLPDAGGWILLIGEPLGMLAALLAVWGGSLRRNFHWIRNHRAWRFGVALSAMLTVTFFTTLGIRVARAQGNSSVEFDPSSGVSIETAVDPPKARFVDQRGKSISISDLRGNPAMLTFAYGHCSTVCPSIVTDLKIVRADLRRDDVRIVILTLDPWRDVPERLPMLAEHWKLAANDLVLSGAVGDVEAALDTLGIGRKRNETTGDIDHGSTVMVLDRNGKIRARVDGGGRQSFASALRRLD